MGFADVTDDVRQFSGQAPPLKFEAGCFSANNTSAYVPTRLKHIVGGLCVGCVTTKQCCGHALVGSACEGGFVCFTMSDAHDAATPYFVAGW